MQNHLFFESVLSWHRFRRLWKKYILRTLSLGGVTGAAPAKGPFKGAPYRLLGTRWCTEANLA